MPPVGLSALLRHLEDRAASFVHLRAGQEPAFWRDNARLDDQGNFGTLTRENIKHSIFAPLDDAQIKRFREQNYLSVALRFKDLGAFQLEAYVQQGNEELVVYSVDRVAPDLLFRNHRALLADAKLDPEDAEVYWNLGVDFCAEAEFQLAWHAFEKARTLKPSDWEVQFHIGKLLGRELCRVDDAIVALESACSARDAGAEAHVELAVMFRSSDRLHDAERALRRGLDVFPNEARLLEALAVTLLELDRHDEAIPILERYVALHGRDSEIEELLEQAHSGKG